MHSFARTLCSEIFQGSYFDVRLAVVVIVVVVVNFFISLPTVFINYFDDMAIRGHALSEGIGFIYGLQFNPERRIGLEQVDQLLNLVAGSARFHTMNIYQITADDLLSARDLLAAWYNLEDVKEEF